MTTIDILVVHQLDRFSHEKRLLDVAFGNVAYVEKFEDANRFLFLEEGKRPKVALIDPAAEGAAYQKLAEGADLMNRFKSAGTRVIYLNEGFEEIQEINQANYDRELMAPYNEHLLLSYVRALIKNP